jgi:hypothetical protein
MKGRKMKPGLIQTGNLKMIEGDDKVRAERCLQNIKVILEQYDCDIHPVVTLTPRGNSFGFNIVAQPRGKAK